MWLLYFLFWMSVVGLAYAYVGYPALLLAWAKRRPQGVKKAPIAPHVSVLVVARNEVQCIQERVANLLMSDYPPHKLDIVVASDGSTDATADIARRFTDDRVTVYQFATRRGKPASLNDIIPALRGDIVVLADSRQRFSRDAIRKLVQNFADPMVGAVGGSLVLREGEQKSRVGQGVGVYWRYERAIRTLESVVHSSVGVSGAVYAIRRSLFVPIPQDTILDDLLIPMRIVQQGYRVVYEIEAKAYDKLSETATQEFARKSRTLAGNFQIIAREPWLLSPRDNRLWIQFVSHKAARLLCPVWIATAFFSSAALAFHPLYFVAFAAQCCSGGMALVYRIGLPRGKKNRILQIPYVFYLLNWAVVVGAWRFLKGQQAVTWESSEGVDIGKSF